MKKYDRILDRLSRAASRDTAPVAEPSPGLATRVLAEVRARRGSEPDYLTVLEGWLVGSMPAALAVAGGLWLAGPRQETPTHSPADTEAAVVDAIFQEALRP